MGKTVFALALKLLAATSAHPVDMAANKAIVLAYYDAAFNHKDFYTASQFLSPHYIQHRPTAADGPDGLRKIVQGLRANFPQSHGEIKHVLADGDFVVLHVLFKTTPDSRGQTIADFYRLADGKIAEHWDVSQDVPATTVNPNGMF